MTILRKAWAKLHLGLCVGDKGDLSRIHDEYVPVGKHSCAYRRSKPPNTHLFFLSIQRLQTQIKHTLFNTVWACFNTTTYQPASIRLCFLWAERTLFLVRPGFLSLSHQAPSTHISRGLFPRNRDGEEKTNGEKKVQFLWQNKLDKFCCSYVMLYKIF